MNWNRPQPKKRASCLMEQLQQEHYMPARYTLKAWHSTLGSRPPQKKPCPCINELTSEININLPSEDPAPIGSTSVGYFWRIDGIRNKLEIHRTHHKLLRSLTSITSGPSVGKNNMEEDMWVRKSYSLTLLSRSLAS